MKKVDGILSDINPVNEADLAGAGEGREASELLGRTLKEPYPAANGSSRRNFAGRQSVVVAIALLVVVLGAWVFVSHGSGQPANRASLAGVRLVSFRDDSDEIVARITDPQAASEELTQVFQAHGLNINVNTVPVSPSLVGTIVYTDVPTIKSLHDGTCLTGGGDGCQVGLVIPADFAGNATVTIGRMASGGEAYAGSADAFGAGEALHCSGWLGETVAAVNASLQGASLSADWMIDGQRVDSPPAEDVVIGGSAISASSVLLEVAKAVPDTAAFRQYQANANAGC